MTCKDGLDVHKLLQLKAISLVVFKVLDVLISEHHCLNLVELIALGTLKEHLFCDLNTLFVLLLFAAASLLIEQVKILIDLILNALEILQLFLYPFFIFLSGCRSSLRPYQLLVPHDIFQNLLLHSAH